MKTTTPKLLQNEERAWYIVDAKGLTLGRLSTKIAEVLHGKHKPAFSKHLDQGDYVIVLNADQFHVTGKKLSDKMYYRHMRYLGHLRETTLEDMLQKHPEHALRHAVAGMLPKNRLRDDRLLRLKLYMTGEHPHEAQKPQPLAV